MRWSFFWYPYYRFCGICYLPGRFGWAGYTLGRSVLLLAMVFVPVGIIIAYQVISFFEQIQYLNLAAPRLLTNSNSMFAHDQFVPMVTQLRYSSLTMISFRQLALFFGGVIL